ncbi:hypothetical protein NKH77_03480 [Streptomyces sp. M19]
MTHGTGIGSRRRTLAATALLISALTAITACGSGAGTPARGRAGRHPSEDTASALRRRVPEPVSATAAPGARRRPTLTPRARRRHRAHRFHDGPATAPPPDATGRAAKTS